MVVVVMEMVVVVMEQSLILPPRSALCELSPLPGRLSSKAAIGEGWIEMLMWSRSKRR